MSHYYGVRPYAQAWSLLQNQEWSHTRNLSLFLASAEEQKIIFKMQSPLGSESIKNSCQWYVTTSGPEEEFLETMYETKKSPVVKLYTVMYQDIVG